MRENQINGQNDIESRTIVEQGRGQLVAPAEDKKQKGIEKWLITHMSHRNANTCMCILHTYTKMKELERRRGENKGSADTTSQ
jgi:hypothetical protein